MKHKVPFLAVLLMALAGFSPEHLSAQGWSQEQYCPGWNNPTNFIAGGYSGHIGRTIVSDSGSFPMVQWTSTLSAAQLSFAQKTGYGTQPSTLPCPYNRYAILDTNSKATGADDSLRNLDPNTGYRLPFVPNRQFNTHDATGRVNTNLVRSIRIGNDSPSSNDGVSLLEYQFDLSTGNAVMYIYYAIVAQSPGHGIHADQFLRISVETQSYDGTWHLASDSLDYIVSTTPADGQDYSTGGDPGDVVFQQSYENNGWHRVGEGANSSVIYKDWSRIAINLYNWLYQRVRIRISISDCSSGVHYAYAYVCGEYRENTIFCTEDYSDSSSAMFRLSVPSGMLNYEWAVSNFGEAFPTSSLWSGGANSHFSFRTVDAGTEADGHTEYTAQKSDFQVLYRNLPNHDSVAVQDSVGNRQTFRCRMTSALDPAKPFTSDLYISVEYPGIVDGDFLFEDSAKTMLKKYIGTSDTVTIPSSVVSIMPQAFIDMDWIHSVIIPNTVISIGDAAFEGCSGISSIVIPNSVTYIGSHSFHNCESLTAVIIPSSVTSMGMNPFRGCTNLGSIVVDTGNPYFDSRDGCNAIIRTVYGLTDLIVGCKNTVIPSSVTSIGIGEYAFSDCSGLTSIDIPSNVVSIGNYAFSNCNGLTSVVIPSSVTTIGQHAFSGCGGMTSVDIPSSITTIKYATFQNCSGLTSVDIPSSVTSLGHRAFSGCSGLTSVVIPSSVTTMGQCVFMDCSSLTSVNIPSSITSIEQYSFYNCSGLTSVIIPANVSRILNNAFAGCNNLTDITCMAATPPAVNASDVLTDVPRSAIIHIPCGTATAYQSAYAWNTFSNYQEDIVYSIKIDSSEHGNVAVDTACNTATLTATPDTGYLFYQWSDGDTNNPRTFILTCDTILTAIFYDTNYIEVVDGDFIFSDAAKTRLKKYIGNGGDVVIPSTTVIIEDSAFFESSVTAVSIPNSVITINKNAFRGCNSLSSIIIPNSVVTMGYQSFGYCQALTSLIIPESVSSMDRAFVGCSNLTSIEVELGNSHYDSRDNCNAIIETASNTLILGCRNTVIPNTVTSIGQASFYHCNGLTLINIPESVTSIGGEAFRYCRELTSVNIPASVINLAENAFEYCSGLTSIVVDENNINYDSRDNCNAVIRTDINQLLFGCKTTIIPSTVTSIASFAFDDCPISSVTFPEGMTFIGYRAFGYNQLTEIRSMSVIPPTLERNTVFGGSFAWSNNNVPVYVPCGSLAAYQAADGWSDFTNIQEAIFSIGYSYEVLSNNEVLGTVQVGNLDCDSNITVEAVALNGSVMFTGWSDGVTDNPRTVHLTSDTTITAIFEAIPWYSVTAVANDSTFGWVEGGTDSVQYGEVVTMVAYPYDGYVFSGWSDGFTDNPRYLYITGDTTLTAMFAPCQLLTADDLPYFEGFETTMASTTFSMAGAAPNCWAVYSNGTNSNYLPHVVTGTAQYVYRKSGENSLVMTSGNAQYGSNKYVLLPQTSMPLHDLYLSFWMCTEGSTQGMLTVGYVTENDTATFIPIESYPASAETKHNGNGLQVGYGMDVELSLESVPEEATRLAFRWEYTTSYYSCCIDDVKLSFPPSCAKVENVTMDGISSESATISWQETGSATEWLLVVEGDTTRYETASDTMFSLNALQPNTEYTVNVYAVCGDGDTSDVRNVTFHTACVAISSLPWTEDFEDVPSGSHPMPFCWVRNSSEVQYGYYPYCYGNSSYVRSGSRSLYFCGNTGASYPDTMMAILPGVDTEVYPMEGKRIVFYARVGSTTNDKLVYVGTMSDPYDRGTFTKIDSVWVSGTEYTRFAVPLTGAFDPYVALMVLKGTGSVYIDDLTLEEIPSCLEVTDLMVEEVTTNSVTLSWNDTINSGALYSVYYGDSYEGVDVDLENGHMVFTVGGGYLEPNTHYSFGVQAKCAVDNNSPLVSIDARTECSVISSLPWTEGFEDVPDVSYPMPYCWMRNSSVATNSYYPSASSTTSYAHSGSHSLYFYGNTGASYPDTMTAILPKVDTEVYPMDGNRIILYARMGSTTFDKQVYVGTMSDPYDRETFTKIDSVWVSGTEYTRFAVPLTGSSDPYVALMVLKGTGNVYIDDLMLEEQPSCRDIRHLVLVSQTPGSATIAWSDNGAGAYEVETRQGDSVLFATTISDTTATIEGLELDNDYEVYVRAVCDSNYGEWSNALNVHIGYCEPNPSSRDKQGLIGIAFGGMVNDSIHPQTAPFYGDYTAMQGSVAAGTTASIDITYATGYTYGTVIWVDWNRSMSFEADEIVYSGESTKDNPTTLAASFYIPATQDTGSYRMRIAGADSYFDSYVKSGGDAPDPCFTSTYATAEDYTLVVTEAPSCLSVTDLTEAEVTGSSVTLSWTDELNSGAWYKIFSINDSTVVDTTTGATTREITGLDALTEYLFGVQAVCDGVESVEMATVNVMTDCAGEYCEVGIYATDSYGDGWNGAAIKAMQNGIEVASYTMLSQGVKNTMTYDTASLSVCDGMPIELHWMRGSYPQETGFEIVNDEGSLVYAIGNGGTLLDGEVFFTMDSCNAAPVVAYDTVYMTACDSFAWNDAVYTESGVYSHQNNSISISILDLVVRHGITMTVSDTAWESYTWGEDVYTESGDYSHYYQGSNGCDSVVTLNLVVIKSYSVTAVSNDVTLGTVMGGGTYHTGDVATIYAIAGTGSIFSGWSNGSTANPLLLTVTNDITIVANFSDATALQPDTVFVHDTTFVERVDTVTLAEYVPIHDTITIIQVDTVTVTEYVDNYIHDTVTMTEYVSVHDTTYVDVYVHDTTVVTEYLDNYIHDTVTLTEYVEVHDTTVVTDTVTLTEYVNVHDTTYVDVFVHDTTYIDVPYAVHDTTIVTLIDTVVNTVFDTTIVTDTVTLTEYVPVHDTTIVTLTDTLTLTDTVTLTEYVAVHDTTVVTDTVTLTEYVPVHDTTYIDVPYAVHDTTYVDVFVHDTTVVVDTLTLTEYVHIHDTTIVTDTLTLTEYISVHDTTVVVDTVIVNNYIHDTGTVVIVDTLLVDNYIYDTVTLTEYVPVHDTTIVTLTDTLTLTDTVTLTEFVPVHDTTYIDVPYAVHDTTVVTDTMTLTEYVPVHDTTIVMLTDTVVNTVYDTTIVTDTVTLTEYVPVHDTTIVMQTDTVVNTVYDTTIVTDTVTLTEYVPVHDTTIVTLTDTVVNTVYDTTVVTDTVTLTEFVPVLDTTFVDVFVHDTTTITQYDTIIRTRYIEIPVYDTTYVDVFVHDTTVVTLIDTVTLVQMDTLVQLDTLVLVDTLTEYLLVHDTTIVMLTDTVVNTVYDTTVVTDTVTLTEYVPVYDTTIVTLTDTVVNTVYDTTVVTDTVTLTEYVPVHDTTIVTLTDTVVNTVYDTTIVTQTDTVVNTVYDTTIVTLTDTVVNTVYDTTFVTDTVTLTEYVPVHDTTVVTWTDTVTLVQMDTVVLVDTLVQLDTVTFTEYVPVHDTTIVTLTDTVTNTVYDTVTNTVFDTVDNYVYDTTIVTDTLWLTEYDTVYISDTVIIHDTVYITEEGIDDVQTASIRLYQRDGQIVVEDADGGVLPEVVVYDAVGRKMETGFAGGAPAYQFDVPASGVYLVKIGDRPARRIVVIR